MKLVVNDVERDVTSAPLTPLLQVLREELEITSPKAGCQQGGCGACTVLVDGEPRRACLTPLVNVDGASITTLEGLGTPDDLSPVQAAFNEHYAAQCGYCTPGFVLAATALLAENASPSREEIVGALRGHICRCTGYVKILEAVEDLAGSTVQGGAR
jgi:aerobic-type carbon monoxide dehydrogenase small subunit (CoxS/CutS family)